MCLGEYGTVVEVIDIGRAIVRYDDHHTSEVSLAVLAVEGITVVPGDRVMVSIGIALELEAGKEAVG